MAGARGAWSLLMLVLVAASPAWGSPPVGAGTGPAAEAAEPHLAQRCNAFVGAARLSLAPAPCEAWAQPLPTLAPADHLHAASPDGRLALSAGTHADGSRRAVATSMQDGAFAWSSEPFANTAAGRIVGHAFGPGTGVVVLVAEEAGDLRVAALDAGNGTLLWSRLHDAGADDRLIAAQVDGQGRLVLVLSSFALLGNGFTLDAVVARIGADGQGSVELARESIFTFSPRTVHVLPGDDLLLVGHSGPDLALRRLAADGTLSWSRALDLDGAATSPDDELLAVSADPGADAAYVAAQPSRPSDQVPWSLLRLRLSDGHLEWSLPMSTRGLGPEVALTALPGNGAVAAWSRPIAARPSTHAAVDLASVSSDGLLRWTSTFDSPYGANRAGGIAPLGDRLVFAGPVVAGEGFPNRALTWVVEAATGATSWSAHWTPTVMDPRAPTHWVLGASPFATASGIRVLAHMQVGGRDAALIAYEADPPAALAGTQAWCQAKPAPAVRAGCEASVQGVASCRVKAGRPGTGCGPDS